jgi:RNA polymerase sigma-70 factor, ECF subfamily
MTGEATELSEATIRSAWDASDFDTAATMALRLYHAEILSFLVWRLRSPSDGQEAFSMLIEGLWSGMPRFGWRCSLRSWMYVLARNAALRLQRAPHKRFELQLSDSVIERLSDVLDDVRTQTQLFRQTYAKNRVRQLRDSLSPEDQLLLVLRVDRGLSWADLALAIHGDAELDGEHLKRESARLRQCFRRIKQELRRLAAEQGLSAQD